MKRILRKFKPSYLENWLEYHIFESEDYQKSKKYGYSGNFTTKMLINQLSRFIYFSIGLTK